MAYEPTTWKSGDVVTSAKLNKIEAGIASGGVLVATDTEGTLDKTWQEIHDAAFAVVKFTLVDDTKYFYINSLYSSEGIYYIELTSEALYETTSANGYPVYASAG